MVRDPYDEDYFDEDDAPKKRDGKIDEAKTYLLATFFLAGAEKVYYGRQLEIACEELFYHWITKKALNELAAERKIQMSQESLGTATAHMYYPRGYRYARRQIADTLKLIREFSDPVFTRALGVHGEMLADIGFAHIGFRIVSRNVSSVGGRRWTASKHDLDRLVRCGEDLYGVEVKNQLGYIDQTEFEMKMAMCKHLQIRPVFIARMMPKSYIFKVAQQGGFCLILKNQHYPLMSDDLARRVKAHLGLPVLCLAGLPDTTFKRIENWRDAGHVIFRRPARKM